MLDIEREEIKECGLSELTLIDYITSSVEILMKLKWDEISDTYNNTALLKNYKPSSGLCAKCGVDVSKKMKKVVIDSKDTLKIGSQ